MFSRNKKPTTGSVAAVDKATKTLAEKGLKARKGRGTIRKDAKILSIADHGDHIMVYTGTESFGMRKETNGASSKTK